MGEKTSFVFYKTYYDAIKELDTDSQVQMYDAIMQYALYGNEIELDNHLKPIFVLIKVGLDNANKRYEASVNNGKKGGRPKKETQKNLEKPNQNLNVNDNVNDNNNNICPSDEGQFPLKEDKEQTLAEDFDKIWQIYPRKEGKNTAFKHYKSWLKGKKYAGKIVKLNNVQMWFAVKRYADMLTINKTEKQYVKMGSTFFNEAILEYVDNEKGGEKNGRPS